jgi:hypothetical protein
VWLRKPGEESPPRFWDDVDGWLLTFAPKISPPGHFLSPPNPEVEELKARIIAAWKAIEYPGGSNLLRSSPLKSKREGSPYDPLYLELEELLLGKTWQEALPFLFKDYYSDSIHVLTAEAFQYYLPAFLIGGLEENNRQGTHWESFLEALYPPSYQGVMECFIARIRILSLEQRTIIKEVFAHLCQIAEAAASWDGVEWWLEPGEESQPYFWDDVDGWLEKNA